MAEDPTESFKESLKLYCNAATFSDVVIRCGEKEFKAHQLILSSHSAFFSKMCTGNWKEADSGVITLEEVDDAIVEAMINFMYHFDYNNTQGISTMVFNAQVYSLADRYLIPALKNHAKDKFTTAIKTGWAMDDFLLAVDVVYSSSPEGDRGLRDLVVGISREHLDKLLKNAGFQSLLSETPKFAADIIISGLSSKFGSGNRAHTYRCPSCGNTIKVEWQEGSYFYCVHCSARRSDWASYRVV